MKRCLVVLGLLLGLSVPSPAAIRYVAQGNPTPVSPYTNWATAATQIQAAVDVCLAGDTVLVSNGVYDTGVRRTPSVTLSNRVTITNAILVQSVNGPGSASIVGGGTNLSSASVRCVYVSAGGQLAGFTLTNGNSGATGGSASQWGGGAFVEGGGVLSNCVITGCGSFLGGGGVCLQTNAWVRNCTIVSNRSTTSGGGILFANVVIGGVESSLIRGNTAGGVYIRTAGVLSGCLVAGNSSSAGVPGSGYYCLTGGTGAVVRNCTFAGNQATNGPVFYSTTNDAPLVVNSILQYDGGASNWAGGSYSYCLMSPAADGIGNLAGDPWLNPLTYQPAGNSPALEAGDNTVVTEPHDLAGRSRIVGARVDMGAYEFAENTNVLSTVPTATGIALLGVGAMSVFTAANGSTSATIGVQYRFDWGDGATSGWTWAQAAYAWSTSGTYGVRAQSRPAERLAYESPWSAPLMITTYDAAPRYVAPGGSHVPPFTSWATAATSLQAAVDVAVSGDTVWVSNGIYATGTRLAFGSTVSNRLAVSNGVVVRSLNGPGVTTIQGGGTSGVTAVRCVALAINSQLIGFTLVGGFTSTGGTDPEDRSGAGAFLKDGGMVSNCIITSCRAYHGGGVAIKGSGLVTDCLIVSNRASNYGGGGRLYNATNGLIRRCVIRANSADTGGGVYGANAGRIEDSLLVRNAGVNFAGGLFVEYGSNVVVSGCTIAGNQAGATNAGIHHYITGPRVLNSIVAGNTNGNWQDGSFSYSFANPLPPGTGNRTGDPLFVDESFHLSSDSPARDAGDNSYVVGLTDVDGDARIDGTVVDMGAQEFNQNTNLLALVPSAPTGATFVARAGNYFYSSSAADTAGGGAEIRFDWGDGAFSTWATSGAVHAWSTAATYNVRAQARPAANPAAVTDWSDPLSVTVYGSAMRYVAPGGLNIAPFTNWAMAATQIQAAVDAAVAGDSILVSNGVYDTGTRFIGSVQQGSRLVLTNGVSVRSVEGAGVTVLQGDLGITGASVRCVYVGNGCSLAGFTLRDGRTIGSGLEPYDTSGGGVLIEGNGVVSNCVIRGCRSGHGAGACLWLGGQLVESLVTSNFATGNGGGLRIHQATNGAVSRCVITTNYAAYGGGIYQQGAGRIQDSLLANNLAQLSGGGLYVASPDTQNTAVAGCTVAGNRDGSGAAGIWAAANGLAVRNSIVYANTNGNWSGGTYSNCLITPLPANGMNWDADPVFTDGVYRVAAGSPAEDAGHPAFVNDTLDVAGNPRVAGGRVDIGAFERQPDTNVTVSIPLPPAGTNSAMRTERLFFYTSGAVASDAGGVQYRFDWGDGSYSAWAGTTAEHVWTNAGVYLLRAQSRPVANVSAESAWSPAVSLTITAISNLVRYVAPGGAHVPPFTSWATAATQIQAVVDICFTGDTILVSNGIYNTGARRMPGASVSNRLVLTNAVFVRSVNGPAATLIEGGGAPGVTAVRCVYLGSNSHLSGFTLRGGFTWSFGNGLDPQDRSGGGAFITDDATASNCLIRDCYATYGAGVCIMSNGTLVASTVASNRASNYGGGVRLFNSPGATVARCLIVSNAADSGGGVYMYAAGRIEDSLIANNRGDSFGGGVFTEYAASNAALSGCTVAGNWAGVTNAAFHYYVTGPFVRNSIIHANTNGSWAGGLYANCIMTPAPPNGTGWAVDPLFIDGSYHVAPNSPARDAGSTVYVTSPVDLDGNTRVTGTNVDVGPYELQPVGTVTASVPSSLSGPSTGYTGQVCVFVASGSTASDAAGVDYRLDWGDAQLSTWSTGAATHTWTSQGVYTVRAQARPWNNATNESAWSTGLVVTVLDASVISVTVPTTLTGPVTGTVGFVNNYLVSGSTASDGGSVQYRIDWGDAQSSTWNTGGASRTWSTAGVYTVRAQARPVSYPANESAWSTGLVVAISAVSTGPVIRYVAPGGAHLSPFNNWANAATNIQAAVDVCPAGGTVFVSNGVYATGSRRSPGYNATNRLVITNRISVRSVNGPDFTQIIGAGPGTNNAIRCVFITSNASIEGFTLAGGYAGASGTEISPYDNNGGGIFIHNGGTASNCIIQGNGASYGGGGALVTFDGSLIACTIRSNTAPAYGGGVRLYNATSGLVDRCRIERNAAYQGGGVYLESAGRVANSLIALNRATNFAGGVLSSFATTNAILTGCTIVGNVAPTNSGVYTTSTGAHVRSSIVWGNTNGNGSGGSYSNCITTPLPAGTGNQTNNPLFADADYRLAFNSPAIGAGNNAHILGVNDLDGGARLVASNVDVGCYEYATDTNLFATVPAVPLGPSTGMAWQAMGYVAYGATVTNGGVEYRFDWGDGTFSTWNTGGTVHAWSAAGTYPIRVQARPALNPVGESLWSDPLVVNVALDAGGPATRYVALGGGNVPPFTNWLTAATTLQAAVDYALPGDLVLVSNGTYQAGERITPGGFVSNRLVITNDIVVRSVNGAGSVFIHGGNPQNTNKVRCVFISAGRLEGFSLTNGLASLPVGDLTLGLCGGGAYADGGTLVNCAVSACIAGDRGGGVFRGRLLNCVLSGNRADKGGGVAEAYIVHCTVVSNYGATTAGGIYGGAATNSIVYFNSSTGLSYNHGNASLDYSCSVPPPAGSGNIAADPQFVGVPANLRLRGSSPCIDAALPLDDVTNDILLVTRPFDGNGDGDALPDMGAYEMLTIHYVAPGGAHVPPFSTWANAATTIQAAVDVSLVGDTVLVSNGTYATGTRLTPGSGVQFNRVAMTNAVSLRSVNGPAFTVIQGAGSPGATGGVRCVFMTNGASVAGFTLSGGFTRTAGSNAVDIAGGGVLGGGGSLPGSLVSNCVITGCGAVNGGGAAQVTLMNCDVVGNSATNAGGGLYSGSLDRGRLIGNTAQGFGGGAYLGRITNALVVSNTAYNGGGAFGGSLTFCTVADNVAWLQGGVVTAACFNSIVYRNTAFSNANHGLSSFSRSCTVPLPTNAVACISNAPVFMPTGDYRLRADSPCIDAGTNNITSRDLAGAPRPVDGDFDAAAVADMGALEYDPALQDSDGDGFTDAVEHAAGTDPVNALSQPAGISGEILYAGTQTGLVFLLVNGDTNQAFAGPGPYALTNVASLVAYTLSAFRDANGNGAFDPWEPAGSCPANPLLFTQSVGNADITLTDDLVVDTDGDGAGDYAEVYTHGTDPFVADTDNDGFADGEELVNGSDPRDAASSLTQLSGVVTYAGAFTGAVAIVVDGRTNGWLPAAGGFSASNVVTLTGHVVAAFMDVNANAAADAWEPAGVYTGSPVTVTGVTAGIDIELTDHLGADSDGDGLTDYAELYTHGTDPAEADTDGDGLSDGFEVLTFHTDPNDIDTDDDGFSDREESQRGTNPRGAKSPAHLADFDGDGRTDLAVFNGQQGDWHIVESLSGDPTQTPWGWKHSIPTPADYDGDGRAEIAYYNPDSGDWYVYGSTGPVVRMTNSAPVPVPADFDGDGRDDFALYKKSTGDWTIRRSSNGLTVVRNWGWSEAMPVPADYDGDGRDDLAVYHPKTGNWHILESRSNAPRTVNWGWPTAQPAPGDYDGDGRADLAVFHRATGQWYLRGAAGQLTRFRLGHLGTVPVPADFDGDGRVDAAVYQQADGAWLIRWSASGAQATLHWGWRDAKPVLRQYQINRAYGFAP